jgi:hypothetical protein
MHRQDATRELEQGSQRPGLYHFLLTTSHSVSERMKAIPIGTSAMSQEWFESLQGVDDNFYHEVLQHDHLRMCPNATKSVTNSAPL